MGDEDGNAVLANPRYMGNDVDLHWSSRLEKGIKEIASRKYENVYVGVDN